VSVEAATTARTYYEVLRVGAGMNRGEIKTMDLCLAREVHLDADGHNDKGFICLHAAYATLVDPDGHDAHGLWPCTSACLGY
jgi:DnaJ-class molecular chaperone